MSIALWCVLAAAILPVVAVAPGKVSREFDNRRPRDPDYWRTGFRARANWAQENGFEAFPLFAVAVVVAEWKGAPQGFVDAAALVFVAARIGYTVAYWADRATLRSLLWLVGFGASVAIFVRPAFG